MDRGKFSQVSSFAYQETLLTTKFSCILCPVIFNTDFFFLRLADRICIFYSSKSSSQSFYTGFLILCFQTHPQYCLRDLLIV